MDKRVVVLLSGGLDSTIAMRICIEKHGADNVEALSFDYGQKQAMELEKAKLSTKKLGVNHTIIDLKILKDISKGFSANTDENIPMPTIQEVIGDAKPITYVPNRNMILMALAASFAEVNRCSEIIAGFQLHDEYGYHDTTQKFVDSVNSALMQNRDWVVKVTAPFVQMNKTSELEKLIALDGNLKLTTYTLTCYNPNGNVSCGRCPSCSERIQAFMNIKRVDHIPYGIAIDWVLK